MDTSSDFPEPLQNQTAQPMDEEHDDNDENCADDKDDVDEAGDDKSAAKFCVKDNDHEDCVASDATKTEQTNGIKVRHHEARHHDWANNNWFFNSASNCTDDTSDLPHPMNAVSQATQRSRSHRKSQRANADSVDPSSPTDGAELPTCRPSATGSDSDSHYFRAADPNDPTHANYEKQQLFGPAAHPPVTSPPKANRGRLPCPNPAETRPASPPRESLMQIHKNCTINVVPLRQLLLPMTQSTTLQTKKIEAPSNGKCSSKMTPLRLTNPTSKLSTLNGRPSSLSMLALLPTQSCA
jgi:hypothetical protein